MNKFTEFQKFLKFTLNKEEFLILAYSISILESLGA